MTSQRAEALEVDAAVRVEGRDDRGQDLAQHRERFYAPP
jgi:hypothetical protein